MYLDKKSILAISLILNYGICWWISVTKPNVNYIVVFSFYFFQLLSESDFVYLTYVAN
jgi:hypothetical protein